jgi:aminopeptidase YwaD
MKGIEARAMKHLTHLSVEIGPRPVGSKRNRATVDYVHGVFETCGLAVEMQAFPCPAWEEQDTRLEVDGKGVEARANVFSLPCDATAPAVAIGTLAELEKADLGGQIGILYGSLTQNGLSARNGIYVPERDRKIMEILERKKPVALVTVNPKVGCLERVIVDSAFSVPSVTVPAEVGLTLLKRNEPALHLRIEGQRAPGQAYNVVGKKAGERQERIVLCAHLDTKLDTPGAFDNASGVAILLALAESWADQDLSTSVEWVAFNGEEMGGLGDVTYWSQREDEIGQMLAVINVDGVGQILSTSSIAVMACSQSFQDQVAELHNRYSGVWWSDPWMASNHGAFLSRGVPSVAFSAVGAADVLHLPTDTIEWISRAKLGEVTSLIADLVEILQDKALGWVRKSD